MPELSGRPADGTVRQVQREKLQGSQLRLGALRRRLVRKSTFGVSHMNDKSNHYFRETYFLTCDL